MAPKSIEDTVKRMRDNEEVSFADLLRVCNHFFGPFGTPRTKGSHHIFKTPWAGNPRINVQDDKGKAKRYQVRQVVEAIDKLAAMALAAHKAAEKSKDKKK